MSSRSTDNVDLLKSINASGTASATIQIPQGTQQAVIKVSAQYAAVSAAASGVQAAFQTSVDGTTWVNAKESNVTVAPAANVLGTAQQVFRLGDDPHRLDSPSQLNSIKVNLTNLDGTNAATVSVSHDTANFSL